MNSQNLVVVGASCVSLVAGYFVGKSSDNSPLSEDTTTENSGSQKRSATASSHSKNRGSAHSNRSSRFHSSSPKVTAERAIYNAQQRLGESAMVNMDFAAIVDIWQIFDGLDSTEFELALDSLKGGGAMNQNHMVLKMMLLSRWAEVDGHAAAEFSLNQESKGMMRTVGLMGSISTWMKSDPVAAEAWYEKNKDQFKGGMFGQDLIGDMFLRELAKKDFDSALAKLDFNKTSDRTKAVSVVSNLVTDPELRDQAVTKVLDIEDEDLKKKMLEGMVQSLSYQDPEATVQLINKLGEQFPEKFNEYQSTMLSGMAMHDPEAALEYSMTEITDEESRWDAISSSFSTFASQDSESAKKWLNDNQVENKDGLIATAVSQLRWQHADQAMEWALLINDDDARTDRAIDVYQVWTEQHEAGAKAWLEQQDEETQAVMLEGNRSSSDDTLLEGETRWGPELMQE